MKKEPPVIVTLQPRWIIDAPSDDMRLILKALGRKLEPGEHHQADELARRIFRARASGVQNLLDQLDKEPK